MAGLKFYFNIFIPSINRVFYVFSNEKLRIKKNCELWKLLPENYKDNEDLKFSFSFTFSPVTFFAQGKEKYKLTMKKLIKFSFFHVFCKTVHHFATNFRIFSLFWLLSVGERRKRVVSNIFWIFCFNPHASQPIFEFLASSGYCP